VTERAVTFAAKIPPRHPDLGWVYSAYYDSPGEVRAWVRRNSHASWVLIRRTVLIEEVPHD
jgi:hypothetical protein